MDQVRKALAWLKKYHFWVLSVLVVLIGVFCWYSASSSMSEEYKKNEGQIKAGFQTVSTVKGDPFHPNDEVQRRQTEETTKLSTEVRELWSQLYEAQRENVLIWPSGPGELSPDFVKYVDNLEFADEIPDNLREHYQNYIYRHFPRLPEKIGARPLDESTTGAGGGMGFSRGSFREGPSTFGTTGEFDDGGNYICQWADEDQAIVRGELEFPETPSSLRVWCTQENLWVYHAMLEVIKNTNEAAGATRASNAAVRGVYTLQIGRRAAPESRTPNRIYKLPGGVPAAETGLGTEFGGVPGEGPAPGPGGISEFASTFSDFQSGLGAGSGMQMTPEMERAILLSGRYLGEDGKPIMIAGPAAAEGGMEPVPVDPNTPAPPLDLTQFGKEYKRLPVRMVLEMDQRHLPRLIAECANRSLQIEVQEVRINVPNLLSGGMGGGSFPGMGEMGRGPGPEMMRNFGGTGDFQEFKAEPHIVQVGIQGIIYIFAKPNEAILNPAEGATTESFAATP